MGNHWEADLLDRKQDAEFLYNFLVGQARSRKKQGRTGSFVLNLDADWGGGKSFFLQRFARDVEDRGHVVATVNAWRDDHAADPYIAIMAAIEKAFAPYVREAGKVMRAWRAVKSSGGAIALNASATIAKGLMRKFSGVSPDELSALVDGEGLASDIAEVVVADGAQSALEGIEKLFDASVDALIEGFRRTETAMDTFKDKLGKAITAIESERKAPLFVLVDELDRCRPTYAVQLLERVKHLFDVEGVVFVFATNSEQLQHSIAGAYGPNFDGFRYLKRFFDRTYVFSEPRIELLVESMCSTLATEKIRAPEGRIAEAIWTGCRAFGFDLRGIKRVIEMIDAAAVAWPYETPADIALLFPLCANFYRTGKAEWPSAELPELSQWVMARENVRSDYDRGQAVDRSIKLGGVYRIAKDIGRQVDAAVKFAERSHRDATSQYANGIFVPEWNGRSIVRSDPSVQMRLLELVANAGRLASSSEAMAT